ncbi:MAG TPA: hypothetical protein VHD62_06910 [Opitutaceae bacterium]|nr:hypothetical protein [Opitutaceae bacterium]
MKPNFRFPASLTAALALVTAAVPLAGQDIPLPPSYVNVTREAAAPVPTLSIDFVGGSVADLLATLAKNGTRFNLLANNEEMATPLPAFSVRNALPTGLAKALDQLVHARGLSVEQTGSGPIGAEPVFVLIRPLRPSNTIFESFQMEPYLQKHSIQDIIDAIRTAWTMNPAHGADELQVKFHPPTKLLLASGSPAGIELARQVVNSLTPSVRIALSPEDERRRLEAVAQEVSRRRELRDQAKSSDGRPQPPAPPPEKDKE